MKINKVKHALLDNTELFEFFKQFVAIINKYDAAKLKVTAVLNALVLLFDSLQKALDKEKGNLLTKELDTLDGQRDVYISAFVKWLESMTDFPNAAFAANAKEMLHYVGGYGKGIARQTDLSETTILSQIVDGFTKNDPRKEALAAMNGTPWIDAINAVNTQYSTKYGSRVSDDAANEKVESFTALKKKTVDAYTTVTDLLSSRYQSDKADNLDVSLYETCIGDINQLVDKANILGEASKPNPKPGSPGGNPV